MIGQCFDTMIVALTDYNNPSKSKCPKLLNTVFHTCVSFSFFSKTLDPLVSQTLVVSTVKLAYVQLQCQHEKHKQAFKIGFHYLQKI